MSKFSPVTNSLESISVLVQQIGLTLANAKESMTENQYDYLRKMVATDFGIDCDTAIAKHNNPTHVR